MIMHGFGFRPDRPKTYPSVHKLLTKLDYVIDTPDMHSYRSGWIYQNGYGLCVDEAIKRMVQLYASLRGWAPEFLISEVAASIFGRTLEKVYANPMTTPEDLRQPLEDTGSIPEMTMLALQRNGLLRVEDMPGPAEVGFDSKNIFMAPMDFPNGLLVKAYDARNLQFHEVEYNSFEEFKTVIRSAMRMGMPISGAINANGIAAVDPGYNVVSTLEAGGQNHFVTIMDATSESAWIMDNWWRDKVFGRWGMNNGTWLINPRVLYEGMSNVVALNWTPEPGMVL